MPSELQRVARGLVDCFDEIPRVVDQLLRTAARCRENAQLALIASRGQATVAAQQLDAAARACEAAAHFLSMAPPKARGWAEGLVGDAGPSTNRPSSDSANRNKPTSGTGGTEIRTRRLTATYEDLEVAEDNEPPLVTVARKAFEKYRKAHEKDAEEQDRDDKPLLELEITITGTGEVIFEEPDEKEEEKRADRLARDFEIDPDLTEAVQLLLDSTTESEDQQWQHATFTITTDQIEATFDYPAEPRFQPIVVDIELPGLPAPDDRDFDPAFDPRPLEVNFAPGVIDPDGVFEPKERAIADRLAEEGWRVDARPADHTRDKVPNPDSMVRKTKDADGVVVEFKTPISGSANAIKRCIHQATGQAGERNEILIDGRLVDLSEDVAWRAFRRACGQPGGRVADVVHVILGDGRLITYTKEN
ncbi:hypothetical protein [Kribbella sp. C-35]|uniref:hypothetical protein n=1 Tax=Kribbella sp. C-35 TaxID=2789276 RepID=UPI00397A72F6